MQSVAKKAYSLSIQQTRLWAVQKRCTLHDAVCRVRLEGMLDVAIFQQALQELVARHTILRTSICYLSDIDVPVQMISEQGIAVCWQVDLEQMTPLQQEAQVLASMRDLQAALSMREQGPDLRCILYRFSSFKYVLLFGLSPFCADATTLKNMLIELAHIYDVTLKEGTYDESLQDDEPLQYIDVSAWQNELLEEDNAGEEKREFWRKLHPSDGVSLPVPLTTRRYVASRSAGAHSFFPHCVEMTHEQLSHLDPLLQRTGTSLQAFFLASWLVVYWRLTAQTPVIMGVRCDGRYYEELETALGLYSQVVPFSVALDTSLSFERVLILTHGLLNEIEQNQLYFASSYADRAAIGALSPLQFVYEEWPESVKGGELSFFAEEVVGPWLEPFAIQLRVKKYGSHCMLQLWFDTQEIMQEDAQRLLHYLATFVEDVTRHADASIGGVRVLPLREEEQLLRHFRSPAQNFALHSVIEAFEAQVQRVPTSLVAVCGEEQVTYEQLNRMADQLAATLPSFGPGKLAGLYLERSISMLVAVLAVFKAGGAYVPLDPDLPEARLDYQLHDLQPEVVLSQSHLLPRLSAWQGPLLCLDQPLPEGDAVRGEQALDRGSPEDLAYVIYTSGSTGEPKGVMVRHRNLANYTFAMCELLGNESALHFATVSTLAADLGNTAIFCALASGGCVHIVPRAAVISGQQFADYLVRYPIDVLKIVPSHLSALLASSEGQSIFPRHSLILGGEAFSFALLQQLQDAGCACRVINHYGPTEATVGALVNVLGRPADFIEAKTISTSATVPIGRPISGMAAYVLDQYGQIVPVGVIGELYLGGAGIAAGYWRKPEQTRERFVSLSWQTADAGPLYRTGDLVYYRADGTIAFVGRADSQVKLRGYRIELGEIEAVLSHHPQVRDCVVVLREDLPGDKRLVAYVVAQQRPEPEDEELRQFVEKQLPLYMVPTSFVLLHALPLNPNGKVDHRKLPAPESVERNAGYVAPRTPLEELLAEIWKAVLKVRRVGAHDTFARLGGHSLLATRIVARIRQALQIEVPLQLFFEAPTIAELAQRIEQIQRSGQGRMVPALVPTLREGLMPLSFAQQRLWFLYQLQPESTAYLIPRVLYIQGYVRVESLEQSLLAMISRHEVLRSTFAGDGVQTHVHIHPAYTRMPVIDLSGIAHEQCLHEARCLARQEAQYPVTLEQDMPLRTTLIRIADNEHCLFLTMHHIVSDAWSRDILVRELTLLYNAFSTGRPSPLPKLPLQYVDFARWQQQCLDAGIFQSQLEYWMNTLQDIPPLAFPTDYPRPAVQTFRGAQKTRILPTALNEALKQLCQDESSTLFMTLLAAFQVLLALSCDQQDIAVGTPIANRSRPEVADLIGFFTNTLVIRTDLSGNLSFREVLRRVRSNALQAYANQDVPFEKLVEVLQPERDPSRSPLFQVMFVLQHASELEETFHDLQLTALSHENLTAKFDFTLFVVDQGQGLRCTIEYNTDLFTEQSMEMLLERWNLLLSTVVHDPLVSIQTLSLLTEAERQQVLITWNATRTQEQEALPVHKPFEAQVAIIPDAIAVEYQDEVLSYAELNRRANQLAHYLQAIGVKQETSVGITVERSIGMVIAVLAVIKAGGACVPLDPTYPEQRMAFMLENAEASVLITQHTLVERCAAYGGALVVLDRDGPAILQEATHNLACSVDGEQLTYVIYTSGSTGTPKGVGLPHSALDNLLRWYRATSPLSGRVLQFASLSFDVSFFELFAALRSGGVLVLMDEFVRKDNEALADLLAQKAIEKVTLPVVVCQQLTQEYQRRGQVPVSVREVITTGEQLQITSSVTHFFSVGNGCTFQNYYGPSESHVVTAYTLDEVPASWPIYPPIGRPIWNTRIYLLDSQLHPVPQNVPGELYIGGSGLARGYIQQPAMTAERFLPDPFSEFPGERLYKTGDIARYRPDGNIEYLGRKDHQVKVRGYRVELGEIEALLSHHPAVNEVVVLVREDREGDKRLVAYVVLDREQKTGSDDLRMYLQDYLPDYQIPSIFVELEALPLNTNGKVNRQALPHPKGLSLTSIVEYVPPRTEIERLIVTIWQELLDVEKVGLQDNFFDLGGHSLLVLQVRQRLQEALAYKIALLDLFQYTTVSALARVLSQEQREPLETNRLLARTEKRAEAAKQQQKMRRAHRTQR